MDSRSRRPGHRSTWLVRRNTRFLIVDRRRLVLILFITIACAQFELAARAEWEWWHDMPKADPVGSRTRSEAWGTELPSQAKRTPVDYVYRRCYVDRQGNTIDPRTFWDLLLKYSKHGKTVLTSEESAFVMPVSAVAAREIAAERRMKASRKRIDMLEASYLEERAWARKQRKRKKKNRVQR